MRILVVEDDKKIASLSHFSDAGGGRYTKKPYTLEKSGLAVKEELEK